MAAEPLLPLTLFKSRNVSGSNVLQMLIVAGMFGFFFLDSLYLRKVLGYDAVAIGLAFLPVNVSIGAFSLGWSARITTRFGPYAVTIAGLALATAGLAIFSFAPLSSSYLTTLHPGMLLLGVGLGVSFPSIMMFAMSGATSSNSGVTSESSIRPRKSAAHSVWPCWRRRPPRRFTTPLPADESDESAAA